MTKLPFPIAIISWLFVAAGAVGFVYHVTEFNIRSPFANDALLVLFVRLLAVVGGIFTLRGANWGRWLLIVWLAYHVVLSYFHTLSEMAMHAALLAVVAYFLFRPKATQYFSRKKAEPTQK